MFLNVREVDLGALNALTEYPSIPTYHELDAGNGGLLGTCVRFAGPVIGTEKVDGTNARVISLPGGDFLLGSREELLYAGEQWLAVDDSAWAKRGADRT